MKNKICDNLEKNKLEKLDYLSTRVDKKDIIQELHNCIVFYKEVFNKILKNENENMFYYTNKNIPHPLHFELGHVIHFFEYHFLGNTKKYSNIKTEKKELPNKISHSNIFDSLINKPHQRSENYVYSFEEQVNYAVDVLECIRNELELYPDDLLSPLDSYILKLCLLHYDMHKEVIYFITNQQHIELPVTLENRNVNYEEITNLRIQNDWIYINTEGNNSIDIGCSRNQNTENRTVIFDNECPNNMKNIDSFYCQKYPVTYGEYIEFIHNDGYTNKDYWTFEGWKWREENKLCCPINLIYKNDECKWYRKHFNKMIEVDYELPVVHVSHYEASAYAKYKDARVISEEEYVYLTTNGGVTEYPWGNNRDIQKYCNSDYINGDVIKVHSELHKKGANKWGVYGLMGDCWYWTSSRFVPFDGFTIDPIYDTFSYPFFYDRFIVKGSSWCTGKVLVYSKYRNSQEPDKCFHFTGIRLCKDI